MDPEYLPDKIAEHILFQSKKKSKNMKKPLGSVRHRMLRIPACRISLVNNGNWYLETIGFMRSGVHNFYFFSYIGARLITVILTISCIFMLNEVKAGAMFRRITESG